MLWIGSLYVDGLLLSKFDKNLHHFPMQKVIALCYIVDNQRPAYTSKTLKSQNSPKS